MDVVRWSVDEATRLLGPVGSRWAHVRAVAERARAIEGVVAVEDRPTLLSAAYLHDVGYAAELTKTGFHPLDGALWLRDQGLERLAGLVAYHSGAWFEGSMRGFADALAQFPEERSRVADALAYCDLTIGPSGEAMTLANRLEEIELRYGPASVVAQSMEAAAEGLEAAVERTEGRLAACSPTSRS